MQGDSFHFHSLVDSCHIVAMCYFVHRFFDDLTDMVWQQEVYVDSERQTCCSFLHLCLPQEQQMKYTHVVFFLSLIHI